MMRYLLKFATLPADQQEGDLVDFHRIPVGGYTTKCSLGFMYLVGKQARIKAM